MYAALEVGGLIRSLDGGATWKSCNAGLLAFAEDDRYKSRIGSDTDTEGMMDSHALVISDVDLSLSIRYTVPFAESNECIFASACPGWAK